MSTWFLVYVLMTGHGTELHVAVEMPDEEHCTWLSTQPVSAQEHYVGPPLPDGNMMEARDIEEMYCVEG